MDDLFQHFFVGLIFAVCLYWIIRYLVRYFSRAKKGGAQCGMCSETSCPLCSAEKCDCGVEKQTKKGNVIKNCKKRPV